jgi:hypothetical protein
MARLELTRTGVVAVAIAELGSFYVPVNLCHGAPIEDIAFTTFNDLEAAVASNFSRKLTEPWTLNT